MFKISCDQNPYKKWEFKKYEKMSPKVLEIIATNAIKPSTRCKNSCPAQCAGVEERSKAVMGANFKRSL